MDEVSRRDVLGTVPLAATVGVAGCATDSGNGGDSGGNSSGDSSDDGGEEELTYPEGWSEDGYADAETVVETHRSAMGEQSFRFTLETVANDGLYNQRNEFDVRVQPSAEAVYVDRRTVYNRNDEEERRVKRTFRYVEGDASYVKIEDTERENRYEADGRTFENARHRIDGEVIDYFDQYDYSRAGADRDRDPPLIRYASDALTEEARQRFSESEQWSAAIEERSRSTLGVETTGALLEFSFDIGVVDETEYFIQWSSGISGRGSTSVEAPDWLGEARAATSE